MKDSSFLMQEAQNKCSQWDSYPSNTLKPIFIDGFMPGAQWEQDRNKWIDSTVYLPEKSHILNGEFSIDVLVVCGDTINIGYYSFKYEIWMIYHGKYDTSNINFWMPLPNVPK